MKRIIFILLFSMLSLTAQAVPMLWHQTVDFEPEIYFGSTGLSTFTYTHDIKTNGFVPVTDTVLFYDLNIGLYDDALIFPDRKEWAFINLPGIIADGFFEIDYSDIHRGISLAGLVMINVDGLLDVRIDRIKGDFFLGESTIVARGIREVPAPAPLLLLGAGLIGLFMRRRLV
ncbi:PEP-CTERM sorting domain-containing protein [Psychromonas ossibalaenae]|uniref:PEP-CTERM sorting domain-containing protein n=1 Tax=Psychromonas ossibalaenae TaxID=444922 RepID=UPI0003813392|nr:PEP-CTERM sorting domain-containing protein [Psychromonas ossibalaenae]